MDLKRPFRMTRREFVASSTGAVVASSFARRALAFGESSQSARAPSRVIIDTDPGVDDALALLLAMRSPELKIEGITPVAGNVPLELTLPNALRMVKTDWAEQLFQNRGRNRLISLRRNLFARSSVNTPTK